MTMMMMTMYRLLMLLIATNNVEAFYHLTGAGATLPSDVYIAWMAAYRSLRRPFVDLRLSYNARGSGFGKRAIADRSVHYAGSESLLSDADYDQNPDLRMFPALAGSAALCVAHKLYTGWRRKMSRTFVWHYATEKSIIIKK